MRSSSSCRRRGTGSFSVEHLVERDLAERAERLAGLHLLAAHGHGVDESDQFFGGDGGGGAIFGAAVFADEDGFEIRGGDVVAAAEVAGADDGHEDEVAVGHGGLGLVEEGALVLERRVARGGGEGQELTVVDGGVLRMKGGGQQHDRDQERRQEGDNWATLSPGAGAQFGFGTLRVTKPAVDS